MHTSDGSERLPQFLQHRLAISGKLRVRLYRLRFGASCLVSPHASFLVYKMGMMTTPTFHAAARFSTHRNYHITTNARGRGDIFAHF